MVYWEGKDDVLLKSQPKLIRGSALVKMNIIGGKYVDLISIYNFHLMSVIIGVHTL